MNFERYQQAWKAETARTRVKIDSDRLTKEVERSQQGFQSMIFWRDVREAGGSLFMVPVWVIMGFWMALPWTWYLTVVALIWVACFMLINRRRHPQRLSEPGEPLLYYVRESASQVENQIWMLRNVYWWYVLPFSLTFLAFFLHVAWTSSSDSREFFVVAVIVTLVIIVLGWAVHRLNQHAVKVQLEPRHRKLLDLASSLQGEGETETGDIMELVASLGNPDQVGGSCGQAGNPWADWADNWNQFIPSWRVAAVVILPTMLGALCGLYSGLWLGNRELGPTLFQTVVAAVIPFEIVLGIVLWRGWKRKQAAKAESDSHIVAVAKLSGKDTSQNRARLPKAPAFVIILLILFLSVMAFVAIGSFVLYERGNSASSERERLIPPDFADISAFERDDIARIDSWLNNQVDHAGYPSLSVAIVRNGELVYGKSFGFEDVKARDKATLATPYHVASVSKAFTATLAVMLHEDGIIDLDESVAKYLPADVRVSTTPEVGTTMTLRQLASHTSGLPRRVPGRVQSIEGRYALEPERLYRLLSKVKMESQPGIEGGYSNLGFGLLGHILERATGETLDVLLQKMVCEPMQLEQTAFQMVDGIDTATGYDEQGWQRSHSFRQRLAGSGGLVTSVRDLSKFLTAQMQPGVLSRETLSELQTRTKLNNGVMPPTTLGWSTHMNPFIGRLYEKNGGRINCSAWIGFSLEHDVGVAVVTNCGGPDVDSIGQWLIERSVPNTYKPVQRYGYAKVAPYSGMRWEDNQPVVLVADDWLPLISIDGIAVERIVAFAQQEFRDVARKRIAEDLVEVLSKMGHDPGWEVVLGLEVEEGKVEERKIQMTESNRAIVRARK